MLTTFLKFHRFHAAQNPKWNHLNASFRPLHDPTFVWLIILKLLRDRKPESELCVTAAEVLKQLGSSLLDHWQQNKNANLCVVSCEFTWTNTGHEQDIYPQSTR